MSYSQNTYTPPGGAAQFPVQAGGPSAESVVTELHGKYYHASHSFGNIFTTSVPAASSLTLPTTLATLASKFCLVNPAGNTKVFELLRLDMFINSATEVANTIGFTRSTTAAAALATLTTGVINNCNQGGNALTTTAIFYVAATHTDTPVWYKSLIGVNATAVGLFVNSYMFDGSDLIYPGQMVDLVTGVATQANSLPNLVWAEWLLP